MAVAAGILVVVLLALGVRGCLNARKERAFQDYVREVTALVAESDQQGEKLFELLQDPGAQTSVDVQNNVNGFRVEAEQLVDRAAATDHPDELNEAQRFLIEALEFRRDGLGAVARELPTALGDEGRQEATLKIAAQMQNFLASDVIYSQRVIPRLQGPLKEEDLLDDVGAVPTSQFLKDIDWLDPRVVADSVADIRAGGAGEEPATPGLHGTGLGAVTAQPSGQVLAEGGATTIAPSEDLAFDVEVMNQGENDEVNVAVRISISAGEEPVELQGQLDAIAAGETQTVSIPVTEAPAAGQAQVEVKVEGVPGEERLDNNEGTFEATFG